MKSLFLFSIFLIFTINPAHSKEDLYIDDENYTRSQIVISPFRVEQSYRDSPSAVTSLTYEYLKQHGVTSIAEAMRFVPGMQLTYKNSDININYHGTNGLQPRRMNLLIDGISVYRPGHSKIPWTTLPVSIEDIDRIEVIRSPSSATYGPHSTSAVVNIITRHPKNSPNSVQASIDTDNTRNAFARVNFSTGSLNSTISINTDYDQGFDEKEYGENYRSAIRMNKFDLRSSYDISSTSSALVSYDHVVGMRQADSVTKFQTSNADFDIKDDYFSAIYKTMMGKHNLEFAINYLDARYNQPFDVCVPTPLLLPETAKLYDLNPDYVNTLLSDGGIPSGGTAQDNVALSSLLDKLKSLGDDADLDTCGATNQALQEERITFEVVDSYNINESLIIVSNFDYRSEKVESDTYTDSKLSSDIFALGINAEYKAFDYLTFNAGGYYEWHPDTENILSPRFSTNFHISNNHTLRYSFTQSHRTPDMFEQNTYWRYNVSDLSIDYSQTGLDSLPFYPLAKSPGDLESEKIISNEIGYLGHCLEKRLSIDLKFFVDRLYSLISEKLELTDFNPTNKGSVKLKGVDAEVHYRISSSWNMDFALSHVDNDSDERVEQTQNSRWTGFISTTYMTSNELKSTLAYYGASNPGNQTSFDRYELVFNYTPNSIDGLSITSKVSYTPNPRYDYPRYPNKFGATTNINQLQKDSDKSVLTLVASYNW